MQVLFCSDLHLGHALAARNRGFNSIQAHDESIILALDKVCTKRTILWVLGDVAMSITSLHLLAEVPGKKILIRGNHDRFQFLVYTKYFDVVDGFVNYKGMWISHCPIHPQELFGKINVHGHIHKNARSPELPLPYFNVNWDFWGRTLPLEELKQARDKYQNENNKIPISPPLLPNSM